MRGLLTLSVVVVFTFALPVLGQTTSFTFQGRLTDTSVPASGTYQMQFSLYDALSGGTQIGSTITNNSVAVSGGVFTVTLNFGVPTAFDGGSRFIQIAVKKPADPSFTTLTPRQPVTSSPYSIKSLNSGTADNALFLGGQPPASYATTAALAAQNAALQSQITQLQADLAAAAGGAQLWSRSFGSTGSDGGSAIAVDAAGNVFVTGNFESTVNFGGGNLTSAGGSDIFVAKYSGITGAHLWSRRFGGTSGDFPGSLAIDNSGNVFITGNYASASIDFGGGALTNAGAADIFLAKLSGTDGSHLWSRRFGGIGSDSGRGVAVSAAGDVYITGNFNNTVDFGALPLVSAGSADIFVAKYSGSTSVHIWSRRFGGTIVDVGYSVAVDSGGNTFVTGYYGSSSIDFGGGPLSNAGAEEVFLAKLASADGTHLFSRRAGGPNSDLGVAVDVDSDGNAFMVGYFLSTSIDLGGGARTNNGGFDIHLAKYDAGGTHQWSRALGGTNSEEPTALSVDGSGNPVVAGYFSANTTLGGGTLNSAGSQDGFTAKYIGSDGSHLWSKRFGGTTSDMGQGVAVDNNGDAFVTGFFGSPTIDFGGGPLTNAGLADIFIAKLRR